ncbi:transketolase C-terminal domain-containing protein [Chloroflexota bacterium]
MERTVADTIKEITREHLEKGNGLLLGQSISAVGWVNNTVPDCQGIIELPIADVAGAGIAVGTALVGRRPIFVIRFHDFLFLNSNHLVNYAAKSKEVFGIGAPIFIRALATEGNGAGPTHSACLHSIFAHMPGMRVCSPMTPKEYEEAWGVFLANDEPMFVSEHRRSFTGKSEMPDIILGDADITIFAISAARFSTLEAVEILRNDGIKCNVIHIMWLKPFTLSPRLLEPLENSRRGLVIDSDFEIAGVSQSIAYELMLDTGLPVRALGREDHSSGAAQHLENGTPTPLRITQTVKDMLRNRK